MSEHEPGRPREPDPAQPEDAQDTVGDTDRSNDFWEELRSRRQIDAWDDAPTAEPVPKPTRETEEDRAERARRERARRSRNPVVRATAGLPRPVRIAVDWIVTIVGAIAIVLAIKAWVVNPYRIPSSSMEPTLHCARPGSGCETRFSDRVLANRFIYHFRRPKRGDIVVFKTPPSAVAKCGAGGTFVKRLIALPGEMWEERDGIVYIDGRRLVEPYVKPNRRDSQTYPPRRIPQGRYFFMGDNRSQSCDSREWGAVPRKNLIGEVFFVYWPPTRIGFRAALILLGFVVVVPLAGLRRRGRNHSRLR